MASRLTCGPWAIEAINLDGRDAYRVTRNGLTVTRERYPRTPEAVVALLRRLGAPDLSEFDEE